MSESELEKKVMEETKSLSSETLMEVLDFAQFMKAKEFRKLGKGLFESSLTEGLDELDKTSLAHLEEEFAHYKELYPYE